MKVYIASSSKFVAECKNLASALEKLGFTVTRRWWEHYIKEEPKFKDVSDMEFYAHPQVETVRELDFKAIRDSDMVVIITKDEYKLTGALIELGYALAFNKPVYLMGKFKRSAMLSSGIRCATQANLYAALKRSL